MRGQLSEVQRLKQINTRLKNENARLRARVKFLEEENVVLKEKLEKALLEIEELKRMIFGRYKKNKDDNNKDDDFKTLKDGNKKERGKESYRRKQPSEKEITRTEYPTEETCPHCKNKLTKLKKLEFFIEDIIPPKEWFKFLKEVIRKWIITGYCSHCEKRVSTSEIPKQRTTLGENIRQLIVFQATVQQLSYPQIIEFCEGLLKLKLSEGEITNILKNQSVKLEGIYEGIKETIRDEKAVNMDETSWPTIRGEQGNYAWVATATQSEEVLYSIGQSRGQGNIWQILGKKYKGIVITDDYNAYKNAFSKGKHALCWAHPYRKIRDLAISETLPVDKKEYCQNKFKEFSKLYEEVRKINNRPFNKKERKRIAKGLSKKFDDFISLNPLDPCKLRRIKTRMKEQKRCYLICILESAISPDNNRAERALRHLVIKRRKSFGSKTQKGADVLSILYTVIMSFWRKSKENFFSTLHSALHPVYGGQ